LSKTIFILGSHYKQTKPNVFLVKAIRKVAPIYGLATFKLKKRVYQVPTLIPKKRGYFLAITWIMSSIENMKGTVQVRLAKIISDIMAPRSFCSPLKLLKEHYQLVKANMKNSKYKFAKRRKRKRKKREAD